MQHRKIMIRVAVSNRDSRHRKASKKVNKEEKVRIVNKNKNYS